ncbi:hypothetical protein LC607_01925 [Nostoc sp. CHAB 5824]|nr:hypothetical protein [Nostoc sp. CHAB 5824]
MAGAKLAVISEWVNKTPPRLTPLESEFLHKSLERRDRQNRAELEQAKKLQREAEAKAKAESQRTRFAIVILPQIRSSRLLYPLFWGKWGYLNGQIHRKTVIVVKLV